MAIRNNLGNVGKRTTFRRFEYFAQFYIVLHIHAELRHALLYMGSPYNRLITISWNQFFDLNELFNWFLRIGEIEFQRPPDRLNSIFLCEKSLIYPIAVYRYSLRDISTFARSNSVLLKFRPQATRHVYASNVERKKSWLSRCLTKAIKFNQLKYSGNFRCKTRNGSRTF